MFKVSKDNLNKKYLFSKKTDFIFILLYYALPYLIVLFCAIKMIRYVNAHTGYDNNMKKMLKQLTFTLILLV